MDYKMICFDMDGVIFKDVNFWMVLHKKFETLDEGRELTRKYLHADYETLVQEVVNKLWKGKNASVYFDLIYSLEYVKGVEKVMDYIKKRGLATAIISASSIDAAKRIQKDHDIDYVFANEMKIKDGKISGEFVSNVGAGNEKKAQIITMLSKKLKIPTEQMIYVGDSDTDVAAFKEVGLSIAFNSHSETLKQVATCVVDTDNLEDIIKYIK